MQLAHRETTSQLRTLRGSALDRIFIDAMVAEHRQLLPILTQNATSPKADALKAHATAMERTVTLHLNRAKAIQMRLATAAAADPTP